MTIVLPYLILSLGYTSLAQEFDVFDFIDPLIGTDNGGNAFAGATLPYDYSKLSSRML